MDDLTTERSFNSPATWVSGVLGLLFDMLPMDVCTTRHCQASGRLLQEINVCTVNTKNASTNALSRKTDSVGIIRLEEYSFCCRLQVAAVSRTPMDINRTFRAKRT